MRILVVSDDERSIAGVRRELTLGNHQVQWTPSDSDSLVNALSQMAPEVLVIDLPGSGPGARTVRQRLELEFAIPPMPTFLLIHQEALDEFDLTWGADDFVVVPGAVGELAVRIRLLFWTQSRVKEEGSISFGDLSIDFANYEVRVSGSVLDLTFKEFELLKYLVTHRSRVHTRESLLARVWGYDYYGGTRTIDVHVRRIRSKLGPEFEDCIDTVRGVGYRFTTPESKPAPTDVI